MAAKGGPQDGWQPLTPAQQRLKDEAEAGTASATVEPPAPAAIPGAAVAPPRVEGDATEVEEITPLHLAEIRKSEEGFSGALDTKDGPTGKTPLPATPQEAIQIIETLTNEKIRVETERDSACAEVDRYYKVFGPLPEGEQTG